MSKFEEAFKEPFWFSHGYLMLSASYSKDEALEIFKSYDGDNSLTIDQVKADRVRFGFPSIDIEDVEMGVSCWHSNATGKGSKAVWFLDDPASQVK